MYIDSHAHLTCGGFTRQELADVIKRALNAKVEHIVTICTTPDSLQQACDLQKQHPMVLLAGSTTPHDAASQGESAYPVFAQAAANKRLVAIGETGLDYYYYYDTKEIQKKYLIKYFELAKEHGLPVIIHCRDAFDDLLPLIDTHFAKGKGVLHCFTGSQKDADELLKRGWFLSFSGIVTFKKSEALRNVAASVPLDKTLIETDAPYLAPQKRRSTRNEPSFIPETAAMLAGLHNISLHDFAQATTKNARQFFCI